MDHILAYAGSVCNRDMRVDGPEPIAVEDLTNSLRKLLEGEVVELCGCHGGTEVLKARQLERSEGCDEVIKEFE